MKRHSSITRFALALTAIGIVAGCDPPPRVDAYPPVGAAPPTADGNASAGRNKEPEAPPKDTSAPSPKSFDDIKFDIEPDGDFHREMLTDEIVALDGKRIRIRGWILPTAQRSGIKKFVLVRDNQECCFGPGAALFDCILVSMAPGKSAEFSTRSVAVEGTFEINEFPGPGGRLLAVYRMTGEKVER